MLGQRRFHVERAEEVVPFLGLLALLADFRFDCLKADNYIVFLDELLQLNHKLGRVDDIHDKHAEKQPDHEGKR